MLKLLPILLTAIVLIEAQNHQRRVQLDYPDSYDDSYDDSYSDSYGSNYQGGNYYNSYSSGGYNNVVVRRFNGPNNVQQSVIQVADPHIDITNGKVVCKDLTCPTDTFKCVVTSKSDLNDPQKINSISECFNKEGAVLLSGNTIDQNPYPNLKQPFTRHTSADILGNVHTNDSMGYMLIHGAGGASQSSQSLTPEQAEQLRKTLDENQQRIQQQIEEQQTRLQAQLAYQQKQMQDQQFRLQTQLANQQQRMQEQQRQLQENLRNIHSNVQNNLRSVFSNLPQFNNNNYNY